VFYNYKGKRDDSYVFIKKKKNTSKLWEKEKIYLESCFASQSVFWKFINQTKFVCMQNYWIFRCELRYRNVPRRTKNMQLDPIVNYSAIACNAEGRHLDLPVCNRNLKRSREIREEPRRTPHFSPMTAAVPPLSRRLVCVVKRKNCYGRTVTLSKHGS